MYGKIKQDLQNFLQELKEQGLYKTERIITSPQSSEIKVSERKTVLNFCSNTGDRNAEPVAITPFSECCLNVP